MRGIANDLVVEIPSMHERDDTDIARAAADALDWHSDLPKGLKVTVNNGWITLEGTVDWNWQKEEAERAVKYLRQRDPPVHSWEERVQNVENLLTVV